MKNRLKILTCILCVGMLAVFLNMNKFAKHYYKDVSNKLSKTFKSKSSPNIVLNTMLKSGSTYIAVALKDSLDYEMIDLSDVFHQQDNRKKINNAGLISKQHWAATSENLDFFRQHKQNMVIHLREPRQVVLAWAHHLNNTKINLEDEFAFYKRANITPYAYRNLTFNQQLDLSIEYFLPTVVSWIDGWMLTKQQEDLKADGIKILITRYDELIDDEIKLLNKILDFYNISHQKLAYKLPEKDAKVRYRSGDPEEWGRVFNHEQKQRMTEIISRSSYALKIEQ